MPRDKFSDEEVRVKLFGGIEAGGTKFVCAVGSGPHDMQDVLRFPTTTPEVSLRKACDFFRGIVAQGGALEAVGVASFGPLDPKAGSATFGHITSTPKPGWANADVVGPLREALGIPIGFDTDVNGAALGEHLWGAAQGLDSFVYLTVGTGIGGGAMLEGRLLHGMTHPEMGHIRIPHDWDADPFAGGCPYHGDCLEGLANGPALAARWGQPAESLPLEHPAWDLEAHYLALALANYAVTLSPQRIILGGGVMAQEQLFPLVRRKFSEVLNGYVQASEILEALDDYIVAPGLGNRAGVLGAIALAQQAVQARR